jgi:hypothetical protein
VAIVISVGGNTGPRLALLVAAVPLVLALIARSIRGTLLALALWLVALGLLRRLVASGSGSTVSKDPLLLVGPAVLAALFIISAGRGAFRRSTPLAGAVLLLSVLGVVEAFNPLQGGLLVGLGGLMLVVVPMLAFWVGREILDGPTLRQLLRLVSILAALDALYGLVQQFAGFPSWDQRWIQSSGYAALNVGGFDRSFGSFSSSQEYAVVLTIGLVLWIALFEWRRGAWTAVQLVAIGAIGIALVLESQRSALVIVVFALGVIVAAWNGRRPTAAILVGAVFLLGLYVVVNQLAPGQTAQSNATSSTSALTSHLLSGLADPTGKGSSLTGHVTEQISGIASGFTDPVGHGTGSVTLAAGSLGNGTQLNSEFDPGNAATAFGFVGLLLYLVVAFRGLSAMYQMALSKRDRVAIAVLGVAAATVLQWLNGELYSVSWLTWLVLGWTDRQQFGAEDEISIGLTSVSRTA